jgi:hypothetical protein
VRAADVADPLTATVMAIFIPALSMVSAALARHWALKRWPEPTPVTAETIATLEAKLERRCERIAVSQGKHQDAFKSWKVGGHG